MGHKFNRGQGATICDGCRVVLAEPGVPPLPFVTVKDGDGTMHFCRLACLESEAARVGAVLDEAAERLGLDSDGGALRRLILAGERWRIAEGGAAVRHDDGEG